MVEQGSAAIDAFRNQPEVVRHQGGGVAGECLLNVVHRHGGIFFVAIDHDAQLIFADSYIAAQPLHHSRGIADGGDGLLQDQNDLVSTLHDLGADSVD